MERRIKFIHCLTICVIIAYCIVQGYWLYNRYLLSLEEYESEVYTTVSACVDEDIAERKALPLPKRVYGNHLRRIDNQKENKGSTWAYDVYVLDTLKHSVSIPKDMDASTYLLDYITNHQRNKSPESDDGIEIFEFTCYNMDDSITTHFVDALDRFIADHKHPFQTDRIDSMLRSKGITAQSITTMETDTMVWKSSMHPHTSVWRPVMTVSFPYNIFERQQVVVKVAIETSSVIRRMANTLLIALLLSFVLIFCLAYQILTIRKQRHIEAIRQEFLHTMIHELKRPISTLKMCVSFMGNERMMQDRESKQKILSCSHNELDNLTSYFSKLRDITFGDSTEIPLVKSRFQLRGLIEECFSKQNVPSDKEVRMEIIAEDDLEIWADRMHLSNIVCNLLENAIKYSEKTVTVRIDYMMREDGQLQITVADDGIGIAKADLRYVFDKFYRGNTAKDKAIPGIGLGLSYVKLLVEAHGGRISLDSVEGEGSTFTILIPQTDGKD